jgi:hypothetical protein
LCRQSQEHYEANIDLPEGRLQHQSVSLTTELPELSALTKSGTLRSEQSHWADLSSNTQYCHTPMERRSEKDNGLKVIRESQEMKYERPFGNFSSAS